MIESMLAALRASFRKRLHVSMPCASLPCASIVILLLGCTPILSAQTLTPGSPISFGAIPVGTTSTGVTFTFSTNAPTVVSAVSALTDGSAKQDFVLQNQNCVGTISPPQTCTVTVAFSPLQVGLRKGALVVYNGAGAIATQLYLSGLGSAPQIVLQPTTAVAAASTPLVPAGFQTSTSVFDGAGDLFFNDITNGRILELSSTGTFSLYATVPTTIHSSLAIAAAGMLYVTEPTLGEILVIPTGGTGVPTVLPTGTNTLLEPTGIAVGNDGYIYVVDAIQNRILRVAPDGSGSIAFTLSGLNTPLATPYGLAIGSLTGTPSDQTLYIADSGNNRVVALNLSSGATTVYGGTVTAPLSLAVDASSTVLVTNGTSAVTLISPTGTNTTLTPLGGVLKTATGIALKPTGDLIVNDTTAGLVSVTRSSSAINFPTTTLVSVFDSTDGYQVLGVQNSGNLPVALGGADPAFSSTAYATGSTSTCPANSGQIAIAATCTYAIGFTPTLDGANPATLTLSSAASATSPLASATVNLTGTGLAHLTGFTVTVTPGNTTPGTPLSFTVAAIVSPTTTNFLGTVTFTATDPTAKFLSGTTYTFTAADANTHTFAAGAGIQFNAPGTYTITATSGAISGTSNQVLVRNPSQAQLVSSLNPAMAGASLTLTATIAIASGTAPAAPSGTVTFMDGSTSIGTGTLTAVNGTASTATLPTTFATPGNHPLTVVFAGDPYYAPITSSTLTEVINPIAATLTLSSSQPAVFLQTATTLKATVASPYTGFNPTGMVTFLDGTTPLGTVTLVNGVATLPVTFTSGVGPHALTFTYTGDPTFNTGTSSIFTEAVQDFSLAPSTSAGATITVVGGNPATFTFALTPLGGTTFPGIVNLTVTGNPTNLKANLAPVSVLGGASAINPTLTINTVSLIPHVQIAGILREILPTAALLAIIPLAFLRRRRKLASLTLTTLLLAAALSLTGCITAASSGYADPANQPNQTYTITLTGNAGQLTHTTTVTLIITAE